MKASSSLLALAYSVLAECATTGRPQNPKDHSHKPAQTPPPKLTQRNLLHGATHHTSNASPAVDALELAGASLNIGGIAAAGHSTSSPGSASSTSSSSSSSNTSSSTPSTTHPAGLSPADVVSKVISAVESAIPIYTNVYDYTSSSPSSAASAAGLATAATAAMASPSCTTIFAPYANATRSRTHPLATGRAHRIVASASGSLITAAPVSTVLCHPAQPATNSNSTAAAATTTQSSFDVFYNAFSSTYTYPDGATCTLLPKGHAAIVISYYRQPESTVTVTIAANATTSDYSAPYAVPAQPTWCNFLLTPTPPAASKTGGFVLSIGGAMTAYDVLGSDTTSTIYAVDHNPSVIFVTSQPLPSYGAGTSSAVEDHASAVDAAAAEVAMGAQVVTAQDFQSTTTSSSSSSSNSASTTSTSASASQTSSSSSSSSSSTLTVLFPEASPASSSTMAPVAFSTAPSVTGSTGAAPTPTSSSRIALQIQSAGALVARTTSFAVTAGPTQVVINDNTYSDLDASRTTTVACSGATFTIDPSRIVEAGGATISRLVPGVTGLVADVNTSTVLHGLPVAVTRGTVQLGDYVYTIGAHASTETVMGQLVTIAPTGIAIASAKATLAFSASVPDQTEIIVAGGQMVTAQGQSVVVIRRTSFTYTTATATLTSTIDDNTLLIGPSGVIIDATTTLGGPAAPSAAVQYAIVGGATLTQVGASKLIVHSTTYTIGPHGAAALTTITAGGQTISISSGGVEAGTVTLDYPFGPSVTTTLVMASTTTAAAAETSAGSVKANTDSSSSKKGGSGSSSNGDSSGDGSSHVKSGTAVKDGAGARIQTPSLLGGVVAGAVAVLLF